MLQLTLLPTVQHTYLHGIDRLLSKYYGRIVRSHTYPYEMLYSILANVPSAFSSTTVGTCSRVGPVPAAASARCRQPRRSRGRTLRDLHRKPKVGAQRGKSGVA